MAEPQVGDQIYLQSKDGEQTYQILDIEDGYISAQSISGDSQLVLKFISREDITDDIDQVQLTGNPYADIAILEQVDNKTLANLCQSSTYINSICKQIWRNRMVKRFNFIPPLDMTEKDLRETYSILLKTLKYDKKSIATNLLGSGRLDLLKWFASQDPPIYPSTYNFYKAFEHGHLDIIEWIQDWYPNFNSKIDKSWANYAAENGHIHILEWLTKYDMYPDQYGSNRAAVKGQLDALKWIYNKTRILPTVEKFNLALKHNHVDVAEWLFQHNPNYVDTLYIHSIINGALENGSIEALEWLSKRYPYIYPESNEIEKLKDSISEIRKDIRVKTKINMDNQKELQKKLNSRKWLEEKFLI